MRHTITIDDHSFYGKKLLNLAKRLAKYHKRIIIVKETKLRRRPMTANEEKETFIQNSKVRMSNIMSKHL